MSIPIVSASSSSSSTSTKQNITISKPSSTLGASIPRDLTSHTSDPSKKFQKLTPEKNQAAEDGEIYNKIKEDSERYMRGLLASTDLKDKVSRG